MYGIELISRCGLDDEEDAVTDLSSSKQYVAELIQFLYENSIGIGNWRDVLADIYGEKIQRMG